MSSTFARFPGRLQEAIVSRLDWTSLRPVQEEAGAAVLDGKNVVVLAPTAGGKTEAAIFPVLAGLLAQPSEAIGTLYIAPIKALLNNQEERLGTYTEMVGLRRFVWHGDRKQSEKTRFTKEPDELLMLTPESLEVMLLSPRVPAKALFRDLRYVVVDEVHAFAGTDRGAHLMSVVERVARFTPNDLQRIGLSATVGNPADILRWLQGFSRRDGVIIDPPKQPAARELAVSMSESTLQIAKRAVRAGQGKKSLFFCQSRSMAEAVAQRMRDREMDVFVHHSSVSLEERRAAEERFHRGTNACIVCTSTLELGIDVGDLDLVFQENAPSTVASFLQRMGRTGRRPGLKANTTFLCEEAEAVLQSIALIELARSQWVESVEANTRCWPVLVHQLLALTLEFGAVRSEHCWEQLSRVPDFSAISREEFDAIIDHMIAEDFLHESGGLFAMGDRAERVYGRKNFLELYAVFSSPVHYRVHTEAGRDLGSLEQAFVDRLVEQMSSFLLGGRAWLVDHVNHSERIVRVKPAPAGRKPSWGGFIPQHLGREICERIRGILVEDFPDAKEAVAERYPYLDGAAQQVVKAAREDLGPVLRASPPHVQIEGDTARWWTFAGGRVNHTLKYGLEALEAGWKIVADNFLVRVQGCNVTYPRVLAAIERLSEPDYWMRDDVRADILARVPEYRLSKFQLALPPWAAAEMVGRELLDFEGTGEFLRGRTGYDDSRRERRAKAERAPSASDGE